MTPIHELQLLFMLGRPEKLKSHEKKKLNCNFKSFVLTKLNVIVHISIDRVYFHVHSVLDVYKLTSAKYSFKQIT